MRLIMNEHKKSLKECSDIIEQTFKNMNRNNETLFNNTRTQKIEFLRTDYKTSNETNGFFGLQPQVTINVTFFIDFRDLGPKVAIKVMIFLSEH